MLNLNIIPDEEIVININESYISILEEAGEDCVARVLLQEDGGYGVMLPTKINLENKTATFILPEQLCIFLPGETYICKLECILESQLIMPFLSEAMIFPRNLSAAIDSESNDVETEEDNSDIITKEKDIEYSDIESLLNIIAPKQEEKIKKTNIEDIIKNLDVDFVKQAIWAKENAQQKQQSMVSMPVSVPVPVPVPYSKERVLLKNKMKNILLNMIK